MSPSTPHVEECVHWGERERGEAVCSHCTCCSRCSNINVVVGADAAALGPAQTVEAAVLRGLGTGGLLLHLRV